MRSSLSNCASCGAPIHWLRTEADRRMPVDAFPTNAGNVVIAGHGRAQVLTGLFLDAARSDDHERVYMPHHATCPTVQAHRQKGIRT